MSDFSFDYEIDFNGSYDITQLQASNAPDANDSDFQQQVDQTVGTLQVVLQLQSGVNSIASYLSFGQYRYKIVLNRS